jgi:hypothetical protein
MTTSWTHLTQGNLRQAIGASMGGTILAVTASVLGPWSILSGLKGHRLACLPNDRLVIGATVCLIGWTLVEWAVRLLVSLGS